MSARGQLADHDPNEEQSNEGDDVLCIGYGERKVGLDKKKIKSQHTKDRGQDRGSAPQIDRCDHNGQQVEHDQICRLDASTDQKSQSRSYSNKYCTPYISGYRTMKSQW